MSIADKLFTVAENQQRVFDAGKKAEWDKFWDNFQNYGERTLYNFAFWREGWTDENFYPKYDMITTAPNGSHNQMFNSCKITDLAGRLEECGVILDTTANQYFTFMFQYASLMTHIPELNMTNATTVTSMFGRNTALHTIDKMIFAESGLTKDLTFSGCTALANIEIGGKIACNFNMADCPLTAKSVQSVIDALMDLTGSTTKTLTLSAGVALTDTQIATIGARGWTLVQ